MINRSIPLILPLLVMLAGLILRGVAFEVKTAAGSVLVNFTVPALKSTTSLR